MLKIGDSVSFSKTITKSDISIYAGVTGDFNEIHVNALAAKNSIFGKCIAQGMLSVGLISAALGTKFPGGPVVYLSQSVEFKKPVFVGDSVTAVCTIKEILNTEKEIYRVDTYCINQDGFIVIEGNAVIKQIEAYSVNSHVDDNNVESSVCEMHTNKTFFSNDELRSLGIHKYGDNVLISRNAVLYNPDELEIGNNVRIDDYTTISGKVVLGNYIHIAQFCGLYGGIEGIYMDDFSGLSSRVVIYGTSNDYSGESLTNPMIPSQFKQGDINAMVHIGKHVIIGTTSVVLPGVDIEIGCAIGAMSMVTSRCEAFGIYAGVPARRIKNRSRKLLDLEKQFNLDRGGVP